MIKLTALSVMTGTALVVAAVLIVGMIWVAVAIPVLICAAAVHGVEAAGRHKSLPPEPAPSRRSWLSRWSP